MSYAVRGDTTAAVTWQAPNNQGCAISGYTVTATGGRSASVGGGQTAATVDGLSNGTSYSFTVVARNEVGDSARSAASNAVTPAGLPGAPTLTGATPDEKRVALTWTRANDNGSPVTTYQLSVNGGGWENVGNGTSYTRPGLADSTTYTFQLRAVNEIGPGAGGNTVSAKTPGPPNQVGGVSAAPRQRGQLIFNWSAPADNGKPIQNYEVVLDPDVGVARTVGTSYIFDNLQDDTTYRGHVRACNEIGCGPWSAYASAKTDPAPAPPSSIRVSHGRSAVGQNNCSSSGCAFLHAQLTNMAANHSYQIDCYGNGAKFDTGTANITTNGSGDFDGDLSCYYGFTGNPVYFTAGGQKSNTITW